MKEVMYDYEEFKRKADPNQPIHHTCIGRWIDKYGTVYRLTFRIYAKSLSPDAHIIVFESSGEISTLNKDFHDKYGTEYYKGFRAKYEELVEKYAKPIGSTEGRLEE